MPTHINSYNERTVSVPTRYAKIGQNLMLSLNGKPSIFMFNSYFFKF